MSRTITRKACAAQIADSQPLFLKRQAVRFDALKVSRLERELVDAVDFVTAITQEDLKLYQRRRCDKPMGVLTPGYCGRRLDERSISGALPRRAVIVGSFDWIAKRMNLAEFVDIADPLFADAGAELQAVGSADEAFLEQLRQRTLATRFTGTVPDIEPYLDDARIAIVPERNGGGFKLKVLEYVFNRVPVFALTGSFAGVPLVHNDSVMLYPDHAALAHGVLEAIDDVDLLNRLQERAFARLQRTLRLAEPRPANRVGNRRLDRDRGLHAPLVTRHGRGCAPWRSWLQSDRRHRRC